MKKQFQGRANFIAILFLFGSALILFQVIRIQSMAELFQKGIDAGETSSVFLESERGKIFDQHGHMLAGNETIFEIGVTLPRIKDEKTIAKYLYDTLGLDYQKTLNNIDGQDPKQVYLVLANYVPLEKALKLQKLKKELEDNYTGPNSESLAGLEFVPHMMRSYPDKQLASNVIGFVNQDKVGNYGVEQKYNSLLAGVSKTVLVPLDPNLAGEIPKTPVGSDLILTIDREIQAMVETELNNSLIETGSEAGTIIVMDPHTGGIIAMASTPQMDLNQYSDLGKIFPGETPYNRAISLDYEPGSVFKILTMAAAIDINLVSPETTYLDSGFYTIGGVNIYNWDRSAWGVQSMVGCLQNSLNVCMARLADLMGENTFYTYMQRFGIGHPTGIDLSYETGGRLKVPADSDWYKVDLGTNAFGQGVSVTPIQMMTAASALANDGKMVYPHLLYAMVTNGAQHNTPLQTLGSPISPQTARTVSGMLADALDGSKSVARVDGYRIAGKTGSASIPVNGVYQSDQINASFIGWGPVDDPKFMVYVWLQRPKADWASYVASPLFSKVVEKLVVLMDIPPDNIRKQLVGQ